MNKNILPSEEQLAYAEVLFWGCWAGLSLMLVTYLLYVSGIVAPYVPLESMPHYWSHSVNTYLRDASVPSGWGWYTLLAKGDFLNFIGIVVLAVLSVLCYLRILPPLLRKKDTVMCWIVCTEIVVLLFAASGIVGAVAS